MKTFVKLNIQLQNFYLTSTLHTSVNKVSNSICKAQNIVFMNFMISIPNFLLTIMGKLESIY